MFGFSWHPFTPEEELQILTAIAQAELQTSGEIRVHVDKWCKTNPLFKARNTFLHLKMDTTKLRNGVLIYVAKNERKFAIVGDIGISEKVPADFWESTKEIMRKAFAEGNLVQGISLGIEEAGKQLKIHFPYDGDTDENELPNEISYG